MVVRRTGHHLRVLARHGGLRCHRREHIMMVYAVIFILLCVAIVLLVLNADEE